MKKNCLIISLIFITVCSYGQSFKSDFSFGLTGNQIDGDTQGGYFYLGGFASVGVTLPLTETLSLSIHGGAVSKGMRNPGVNSGFNLLYMELPMQLHYKIDNVIIGGGVYAAYLARAKQKSGTLKVDRINLLKRKDIGLIGRVGYVFKETNEVFVRADYSVSSIRQDIVVWYNNSLRLGVKIALN